MGPNFLIWIAMAVVAISTILGLNGHTELMALGCVGAIGLAIFNKMHALRRRSLNRYSPASQLSVSYGNPMAGGVIGVVSGTVFFSALVVLILGGLREPYITIAIVIGAVGVGCLAYWRASVARRKRLSKALKGDPSNFS